MSKYSVVVESRNGLNQYTIKRIETDRQICGFISGRSNLVQRMEEVIANKATGMILSRLIGKTTPEEMMEDARDLFGCFRTIGTYLVRDLKDVEGDDVTRRSLRTRIQQIVNDIDVMEGPHGLYKLASMPTKMRFGDNMEDVTVELRLVTNYEVILEGSINAYHEMTVEDGRALNTKASTEEKPVYLDTLRVQAGIRGRFDDDTLFPLLQARLALMKGEPLKSLAKKSLTISARPKAIEA